MTQQGLQPDGTLVFTAEPPPGMTWDEYDAMENDADDQELGAAWREVENLQPYRWSLDSDGMTYGAEAHAIDGTVLRCDESTAAGALRALVVKLKERAR